MRLALVYPDVSSLRRYLVDAGMVSREPTVYRRAAPLPEAGLEPSGAPAREE
jgi:hypothetical protein